MVKYLSPLLAQVPESELLAQPAELLRALRLSALGHLEHYLAQLDLHHLQVDLGKRPGSGSLGSGSQCLSPSALPQRQLALTAARSVVV